MADYKDREKLLAKIDEAFFETDPDGKEQIGVLKCRAIIREFYDDYPLPDVEPEGWISVKDKLPEPETEVLAVCVRNGYRFVCPVIFEDGTMLTQNSMWNWYELENYGTYSEENDDYFIPEGWWENRQFTPDDIYNNPVDCTVTHWMPLPEPPMSARMDGESNGKAD